MNEDQTFPLNSKKNLLRILEYLPHSNVLNLSRMNKLFRLTIKDFPMFEGYTLKFDCGRRGSVVGGRGRFVDGKGRSTSKNSDVVINDKQKVILISTHNKPLKSNQVKEALKAISRTSINKIYFKSYRITQNISAPPSANSSPFYQTDIANYPPRRSTKLQPINEKSKNGLNRSCGPPPASSSRSRFNSGASAASAPSISTSTPTSASLVAPSPSFTASNRQSYSSTISTIDNNIMEISLPSTTRLSTISSGVSVSSGSKRPSTAIFAATDSRDTQFEVLLEILNQAPFESLTIGEECVSWTWSNIMTVLQHFNKIAHLAVHVGFERHKMPNIKSEQKWLDFVGTNYLNVLKLQSLWCNDDAFLRCITSLSSYRNLGKYLTFIEDNYNYNDKTQTQQYEKGSLSKTRKIKPIQTFTEDMDVLNDTDILNGRYIKKRDIDKLSALQFVRYRCQFAPENDLSGIEFEGAAILELSPYDSMFITIPSSVISFRISLGGNFYDEPDEYKIVIPHTNNLRELCLYKIENLNNVHGLYHLKNLQYLVIKKKPKDINEFEKYIHSLSKYAPIKQITLMFINKYKKSRNNNSNDNEYWQNLQTMTVKSVKDKMKISDHPNLISIKNNYKIPMDIPALADQSKFTAYSTN